MQPPIYKRFLPGIIGILLVIISIISDTWLHPFLYENYSKGRISQVQNALLDKEKEASAFLHRAASLSPGQLQASLMPLYEESHQRHILFYITRIDGALVYYSTNSVFPSHILNLPVDSQLQHLANGYYLQQNIASGSMVYIALIPVQYQYPVENQYLQNFIPFLKDNGDFILSKNRKEGYPVYNNSHQYLFSLSPKKAVVPFNWLVFLFIAGWGLIFLSTDKLLASLLKRKRPIMGSVVFLLLIGTFIFVWKRLGLPADLYRWPVFSPHFYGSSSFFSSLGDVLYFSFLSFYFALFFSRIRFNIHLPTFLMRVGLVVFIAATFFICAEVANLVNSLINDSIISFDLSNFFSLNFYSYIGIAIILICVGSYFLFLERGVRALFPQGSPTIFFVLYFIAGMVLAGIILSFTLLPYYIAFVFNGIVLFLYHFRKAWFKDNLIIFRVSCLAVASLFISILLSKYNEQARQVEQQNIASKVITERDPVAEYLFSNIYNDIMEDNYIRDYFRQPLISESALENRIQQIYLSRYFSKYDIDISTFTVDGLPYKNMLQKPLSFYTNVLEKESAPELPDNLFYLHRHSGLPAYISILKINQNGEDLGIVLIQMQQKPFYEESVYPELLVSQNLNKFPDIDKYSYAVYSNGVLLNQKGEYPYPGALSFNFKLDSSNFAQFQESGYTHLVHQPHTNLVVIVSILSPGILYYLSSFAFVFFFMAIGYILVRSAPFLFRIIRLSIVRRTGRLIGLFSFKRLSFRNKILITVISGMSLSMILIGVITVSYISYQYNNDELDKLRKKTRLITTRFSNDLQQNERQLAMTGPDIRLMVKKFSDIYQADINVYDTKGNLINSSESAIYDKQIISPKMDAQAYLKLNSQMISQVIQEERIGLLKFTSCYMPIRNSIGQVIGYLNLPYFSKEQELKNRISSFLEALVNLYLLLFLILVMLGLFMTRVLTTPLDIIRKHLKNTSLSGTNEFIAWNTNDEIGKLVNEYNTMILALKESAERLAQSEREGALKELAQHVAHEIKNPLTPMKLGIQQLQNAHYAQSPDYDALFKKVTTMIIRQIDTLSAIATDFNASAKLGSPQSVKLYPLLQQVTELFGHNLSLSIRLEHENHNDLEVFADPNKLTRVFTNLVNNAVQAIPEERKGQIVIRCTVVGDEVQIAVEDNGKGIPDALKRKIFVPNFSTKSSGTGLGLAISKAIIEQAGGKIAFTSVPDKGSVFTVTLPVYTGE